MLFEDFRCVVATSLVVVVRMQCPIIRRANSQSPELPSDLARSPLILLQNLWEVYFFVAMKDGEY